MNAGVGALYHISLIKQDPVDKEDEFLSILLYWLDLLNESKIYLRVTSPSGSFRPSSNADAAGP